jgi:ATP-dependent Clp protease ATP-binding subunit ClpA
MEGILGASQTRSVKFENELVLLTGNAGGVEVTYNGKPQGSLGEERKRLTLVFPPKAGAQ